MKLVRFGAAGSEKPGLIDADGAIRDLSAHVTDIDASVVSPAGSAKLRTIDRRDPAAIAAGDSRMGAPIAGTRNFIAVGLNYADHAKETGADIPEEPILFNKLANCIVGPNDDVIMPRGAKKLDWEVEIAFVIWQARSLRRRKATPSTTSPVTPCATMSPSAISRPSAAASG